MANYANLKSAIQQVIKTNGNNEITGALLQQSLLAMINSLGGYYQFAGIATPSTNPGTPDQNVFYITTTPGTYQNFGGLSIDKNEVAILKYNGEWIKEVTGCVSTSIVNELGAVAAVTGLSIDKKFSLEWTNGECVTTNGQILGMSSGVYASRRYIPVKRGQKLYLNIHAPGVTDVCAWYDTDYNFLSSFTASQTYVTAPQDGFLRVSNESAVIASPYVQLVTSDFLSSEELQELNVDAPVYDQQIAETYDFDLDLDWETGATLGATGEATISGASYRHTPDYHFTFPGQTFKIDLIGTGTARSVCFYDEDKTFLSGTYGGVDVEVVAPANARFVRFGSENGVHVSVSNVHTQEPFAAKDVVEGINERVEQIEQYIGASFDALSPVEEGLLFATTGEVYPHVSGNNYRYCPTYFRVYPGQAVHTTGRSTGSCAGICFYDENKNFVSSEDGSLTLSNTFTVPEGASYARFCTEYYTTYGLAVTIEPIAKIPGIGNEDKTYFVSDVDKYDTNTQVSNQRIFNPSTEKIEHKYIGQVTPEKRYMSVGFDDFRESDFSTVMPLFEKYGFKATFNKIARSITLSSTDKANLNRLITGRHELGDHSWLHQQFPFTEPMFNGQDPSNPEGNQVPFPTNAQMRNDRGDGKNVFGISLDAPVSTTNSYEGPGINTAWGSLSDAECQIIRNWYSVMKDTSTNLIDILDELSNMFLGTTGSSRGSWDNTTSQYTGGIFTGCKTSANHEIWERYLMVTQMFYKEVAEINYNIKTWSMPGSKDSNCWFEREGKHYYDSNFTKYANYLAKFSSSSLSNADGTPKTRSWTDCLREFGYTATHDYIWPGRLDGTNATAKYIGTQFVLNAKGRRHDAIPYASNSSRDFDYDTAATAYPESAMTGSTSLAAQMYDSTNNPAFKNFIEAARRKMSNGIVAVEIADSQNTYSFRLFFEALLKYCKTTGVELITKQEAYDICFNHSIRSGNLVYNPHLRNTAKEFMPDAQTVPDNPDGYVGNCSVAYDLNGTPILNTAGTTVYNHLGIPEGSLFYKAKAKGTGTIKLQAIKNNNSIYITDDRVVLATKEVNYEDFEEISIPFAIKEPIDGEYDQIYEGLAEKIIGLGIEYSAGLQIKDIKIEFQGLQSSDLNPSQFATKEEVNQLEAKVDNILEYTVEDGLFIVDQNLNIGIKILEDKIQIADGIDTMLKWLKLTEEDGFFIVDESYNIGVRIDNDKFQFVGGNVGGGAAVVNDSIPAPQTLVRVDYTTDYPIPNEKGTVINGTIKVNFDGFILEKYATAEVQGKSSASKPKKNLTFGLFNDDAYTEEYELRIGNMVPHSEFVFKANYGDAAQVRNVGSNILWEQMIFAHETPPYRGNEGVYPYDTGALCHVNGYPCVVYVNGVFYGIGWWNIGKKRDNYDMAKNNQNHIQIQEQPRADVMGSFSETYWEIRNPKNPNASFETKVNAWFADNALTGSAFKTNFPNHHNVRNALDYFLLVEFIYDDDGLDNNIMLSSWDGVEFWMLPYDLDSSFGLSYDGSYITPYDESVTESTIGGNIMNSNTRAFWRKFRDAFKDELTQRYNELKEKGIFTVTNIDKIVSEAQKRYGPKNYELESTRWPNIPSKNITSKSQILSWVQNRLAWMDTYYV